MISLHDGGASLAASVPRARWPVAVALAAFAAAPQTSCSVKLSPAPPGDTEFTDGGVNVSGSWSDVTANLLGMTAGCGTLSGVAASPGEDLLVAGLAGGPLYGSRDGAKSWNALGGAGKGVTNRMTQIVFDPKNAKRFWEAGTGGPSPVVTADDGQTFTAISADDSNGTDGISVDFTDPDRRTILAGGHATAKVLWKSADGGSTWTNIGADLPAMTSCTLPLVIDGQTYLVGCAGSGAGASGIWRTSDGGATWTSVSGLGGGGPPLQASDGSIYWVGPGGAVAVSADKGMNWTEVSGTGTLAPMSANPAGSALAALSGGKVAAVSTDDAVVVSSDGGHTWGPATPKVATATQSANQTHGVVYSAQAKAFYIWNSGCGSGGTLPIVANSVLSFPYTP
jgi:hypothetical protein